MYFPSKNFRGFTLLEFLVSISIGVLILATVIGGQSRYSDAAALKILVNDVSLDIRTAQVYGISVKENLTSQGDFAGAYGLSFHVAYLGDYVYFADRGGNPNVYDGDHTTCNSECISIKTIGRGNKIVNPMCRIANNNTETCDVGRADIVFIRPSTEAKITYYSNATGQPMSPSGFKGLRIKFESPKGLVKSVVVYTTGQISVQNEISGGGQPPPSGSCEGIYNCSNWHGNQAECTGNGHNCTYNPVNTLCSGGIQNCSTLNQSQCNATPLNCSWQ